MNREACAEAVRAAHGALQAGDPERAGRLCQRAEKMAAADQEPPSSPVWVQLKGLRGKIERERGEGEGESPGRGMGTPPPSPAASASQQPRREPQSEPARRRKPASSTSSSSTGASSSSASSSAPRASSSERTVRDDVHRMVVAVLRAQNHYEGTSFLLRLLLFGISFAEALPTLTP
jgi:hypothetical protein